MLDSGHDMLNIILLQEFLESALRVSIFVCLVGKELRPMICDHFSDHQNIAVVLKSSSYQVDAGFGSCSRKFFA